MKADFRQANKDYSDKVARHVRGLLSEEEKFELFTEQNIEVTYTALNGLKKDVEVQLANQRARWVKKRHELNEIGDDGTEWIQFQAEEADWRARAIKFLSAVEAHLSTAKLIRKTHRSTLHNDELQEILESIFDHQESMQDEVTPTEADKQLWVRAKEISERI